MTPARTTLVVASENPVKARAARRAFERMFPGREPAIETLAVPSGVDHQPRSDAETLEGARRRAEGAARRRPRADLWFGIEGGIEETAEGMAAFAWVVVLAREGAGGRARSGTFFLPPPVAELVRSGLELGEADDRVFGRRGSKREEGAVGLLTGNVVDRAALYEHAAVLALVPLRNPGLYPFSATISP